MKHPIAVPKGLFVAACALGFALGLGHQVLAQPPGKAPARKAEPPPWIIVGLHRTEAEIRDDIKAGVIPRPPCLVTVQFRSDPGDSYTLIGREVKTECVWTGIGFEDVTLEKRSYSVKDTLTRRFRLVDREGKTVAECTGFARPEGENDFRRTLAFQCPRAANGRPLRPVDVMRFFLVDEEGYAAPVRVGSVARRRVAPRDDP